jgi:hypothetical protein
MRDMGVADCVVETNARRCMKGGRGLQVRMRYADACPFRNWRLSVTRLQRRNGDAKPQSWRLHMAAEPLTQDAVLHYE